jgi:type IV pilus assembly protein PilX
MGYPMNIRYFRQQGSTLVISLMILVVMTLIGLTGIATSTLEEKMAGNTRDQAVAFQAAEAALRNGENYYNNIVSPAAAFNGSIAGLYDVGDLPDVNDDGTWDTARTYAGDIAGVKENPRYIVELLGEIGDTTDDLNISGYGESTGLGSVTAARITARAVGGTNSTVVMLQSNFAKRF